MPAVISVFYRRKWPEELTCPVRYISKTFYSQNYIHTYLSALSRSDAGPVVPGHKDTAHFPTQPFPSLFSVALFFLLDLDISFTLIFLFGQQWLCLQIQEGPKSFKFQRGERFLAALFLVKTLGVLVSVQKAIPDPSENFTGCS